jgi:hypothetical protein
MRGYFPAAVLAAMVLSGGADAHTVGIDGGLYATYEAADTIVRFSVCGKLPQSSGCYGGGQITTLEKACAVVEGKRKQKNDVVTRDIYVLDKRASKSDPALLLVYRRTDTITQGKFDDIELKFLKQVTLPITGGAGARCAMAANDTHIYVGTDATTFAASVDKRDYSVKNECPLDAPVRAITADARGYVVFREDSGYCVVDDNGVMLSDGGGSADTVGQRGAWLPNQ